MTEEIDWLSAKWALAIPEQESAETSATMADQSVTLTAQPTADVAAEHLVTVDSHFINLQNDVVAITLVGPHHIHLFSSERKTYTKRQCKNRNRIR